MDRILKIDVSPDVQKYLEVALDYHISKFKDFVRTKTPQCMLCHSIDSGSTEEYDIEYDREFCSKHTSEMGCLKCTKLYECGACKFIVCNRCTHSTPKTNVGKIICLNCKEYAMGKTLNSFLLYITFF